MTNACGRDSATVIVREAASDQLLDDFVREIACLGDSLPFSPRLEVDVNYRWEDGPDDPARTFREAGSYVLLRSNTCYEATTTLDLRFADCCQIYFPNAFSPNGDGVNDRFLPAPALNDCDLLRNWSLRLFNRWGGEVFSSNDRFTGWDGSLRDRPAPNGVYVFQLDYFNGRETISRSGSFTLLR